MTYRIVIPDFRFALINQMGGHWGKRARLKANDRDFVWAYAKQQQIPQAQSKRRVSLEITLVGQQKECDPDAPWKSCLDALVHAEMLVDDSPRWCELGTVTQIRGDAAGTVIVLEDL